MHPFYTARLLNSLDHITSGRIAFNVTCDEDSKEKLCVLYAYLIDVLNNGYSKFGGFAAVKKAS